MKLEKDNTIDERVISLLIRNYNTLDYSVKLAALLKKAFPLEEFERFSKYELHKVFNDTIFEYHNGEEVLKYKLFQCFLNKPNLIAAFEIRANNSRVDFLTINGHTTSFEIKSELDNLNKLHKQMADYMLAFEYNYLVIDERHLDKAIDMLPAKFGLWTYKNGKFKKLLKAGYNNNINSDVQLNLLTKKELSTNFPEFDGEIKNILSFYDTSYINQQFIKALKNRYKSRWEFLTTNYEMIFPIDLQFFFNTNIQPCYIYNS